MVSKNKCYDVCPEDQMWDFTTQTCLECESYIQKYENKVCVDRCPAGKSYNRFHKINDMEECITLYDLFDDVGAKNPLLTAAVDTKSLGGSLSEQLTCGSETGLKTYFSERLIPDDEMKDLHFVEIISNEDQTSKEFVKLRFFTHDHDIEKIKDIIDLKNNTAHQCRQNSRACFDSKDSFTVEIDVLWFVEEIFEADGTHKVVQEGIKEYGKKQKMMRIVDKDSSAVEWFKDNQLWGRTVQKYATESDCTKETRMVDIEEYDDGTIKVKINTR